MSIRYLHTMVRVTDIDKSLDFYCKGLGLVEAARKESEQGRFTLVFLAAPDDLEHAKKNGVDLSGGPLPPGLPMVELTYNWDPEEYSGGRNFGHMAYRVSNVYETCQRLADMGVTINRPPRDGHMAFVRSPDNISIEILQDGDPLPPAAPWADAPNIGEW